MRLRDTYRVPLLLSACLVTALLFPRACSETRAGFGALLPATAPLTGAETPDAESELREENARLLHEIERLGEERDARPGASGPLSGIRVARAAAPKFVAVSSRVRHRDASALRRSFSIEAGRAHGVREGMAVIFGGSIVGLVVSSAEHSARVVRIDDPTSASTLAAALAAQPEGGGTRRAMGVARGNGDGVVVSLLSENTVALGDVFVTGTGDLLVPEGLVIGEVVRVGDDDRDGSFEAEVRPLRDLDTMNSVWVLVPESALAPGAERGR